MTDVTGVIQTPRECARSWPPAADSADGPRSRRHRRPARVPRTTSSPRTAGRDAVSSTTPGCRSVRMTHGIETPTRFVLLVEWDSVEAHEDNFRAPTGSPQWRAAIGPYFAAPSAGRALHRRLSSALTRARRPRPGCRPDRARSRRTRRAGRSASVAGRRARPRRGERGGMERLDRRSGRRPAGARCSPVVGTRRSPTRSPRGSVGRPSRRPRPRRPPPPRRRVRRPRTQPERAERGVVEGEARGEIGGGDRDVVEAARHPSMMPLPVGDWHGGRPVHASRRPPSPSQAPTPAAAPGRRPT